MLELLLGLGWIGWAGSIGWVDFRRQRVGNLWWVVALPIALTTPFVLHESTAWAVFLSFTGLALALGFHGLVWYRGWIGGADVKAYALVGWGFGALILLEVFAVASLLLALGSAVHRARTDAKSGRIALLPALSVSLVAWVVTGPWWVGGQGF